MQNKETFRFNGLIPNTTQLIYLPNLFQHIPFSLFFWHFLVGEFAIEGVLECINAPLSITDCSFSCLRFVHWNCTLSWPARRFQLEVFLRKSIFKHFRIKSTLLLRVHGTHHMLYVCCPTKSRLSTAFIFVLLCNLVRIIYARSILTI